MEEQLWWEVGSGITEPAACLAQAYKNQTLALDTDTLVEDSRTPLTLLEGRRRPTKDILWVPNGLPDIETARDNAFTMLSFGRG